MSSFCREASRVQFTCGKTKKWHCCSRARNEVNVMVWKWRVIWRASWLQIFDFPNCKTGEDADHHSLIKYVFRIKSINAYKGFLRQIRHSLRSLWVFGCRLRDERWGRNCPAVFQRCYVAFWRCTRAAESGAWDSQHWWTPRPLLCKLCLGSGLLERKVTQIFLVNWNQLPQINSHIHWYFCERREWQYSWMLRW